MANGEDNREENLRLTEKILAESQVKRRDGNLAAAKLSELVFRHQQMTEKLDERNEHIISQMNSIEKFKKEAEDFEVKNRSLEVKL